MPTPPVTHEVLWEPAPDARQSTRIGAFMDWVEEGGGPHLEDARALHTWSVEDQDAFWRAVWAHFAIPADVSDADESGQPRVALVPAGDGEPAMPGRTWFPGVALNYAEAMLRMPGRADDDVVVIGRSQSRDDVSYTAAELRDAVARARAGLVRLGVGRGDRVVAYAPNVPETLILLLAAASLGAIFSSCAPEFGTRSVIDRWGQIEPTVMLAVDGYRYGTKPVDRRDEVAAIRAALPSLRATVWLPYLGVSTGSTSEGGSTGEMTWDDLVAEPAELAFDRVPFDHPLYLLFSSGTTGLPKPIVHCHGGITLEHTKAVALEVGLGADDVFFWYSTTGWMMWNFLVSGLLAGATVLLYDGNLAHPDLGSLWRMADELGVTYFGTSAPFLLQCRKEGLVPKDTADLSRLRGLGSTGAPLPPEGFRWVYETVGDVHLGSLSGGTDVCTGFVGANPMLPVYAGEISGPCLGVAVEAYDPEGRPVFDELGELVITAPMPSMPIGFWGDDDGARYRAAYFEDFPGVWRHGDWITIHGDGSCVITGRSDATLNRGGVRLGTSEFYTVVEGLDEVVDSLVVHLEDSEGGAGQLMLFVTLGEGLELDDAMRAKIAGALRSQLSPRHVPDVIHQVPGVPRTLSGKKLEVPVKKILRGAAVDDAAARGALQNPETLTAYEALRER